MTHASREDGSPLVAMVLRQWRFGLLMILGDAYIYWRLALLLTMMAYHFHDLSPYVLIGNPLTYPS